MFDWLKSWFMKPERYDLYKPSQMLIYNYWNGTVTVRADPMVLYRRMMEKAPELRIDIKVAESTLVKPEEADKARQLALTKIRNIFEVVPLDQDKGLTEAATEELFDHFLTFLGALKKNSRTSQTLPIATSVPLQPTSEGSCPMPSSADSGCIENEKPSEGRGQSTSELVSPLVS